VLLDDTFASLDDEALERIIDVFTHELQRTTVIHIGRAAQAHLPLFSRVLHLVKAPGKPVPRELLADVQAQKAPAGRRS
jgi:vitamin B12/bleomycin/antimicrobial peptide transport system ATP-binding/permease protein